MEWLNSTNGGDIWAIRDHLIHNIGIQPKNLNRVGQPQHQQQGEQPFPMEAIMEEQQQQEFVDEMEDSEDEEMLQRQIYEDFDWTELEVKKEVSAEKKQRLLTVAQQEKWKEVRIMKIYSNIIAFF